MVMKFHRSLSDLKQLLANHGVCGSWENEPNGVHLMRSPFGANLHWASGSKSVWIDGRKPARDALTMAIAVLLHSLDDGGG